MDRQKNSEAVKRYNASAKGKAAKKRHRLSAKCKATTAAYNTLYKKQDPARFMAAISKARPCADCGGRYPAAVMEYDHLGDKKADIARLSKGTAVSRLFTEIAKCDLVCANCHRLRTLGRQLDKELAPQDTVLAAV